MGHVHYELYIRKTPASSWALDMATEDRQRAIKAAEEALREKRAVSVRVTKETLDDDTREFCVVTILTKGAAETPKPKVQTEPLDALCLSPADPYTARAREGIGRLLDGWLVRNTLTPFELMHRSDMAEKLDASGVELQHVIQKVAVPEAQARGARTHDLMRHFQALVERTVNRLIKDGRSGVLPKFTTEPFASVCERLVCDPDRAYLIGCGVALHISPGGSWGEKLGLLLDMADAMPEGEARSIALQVLEQPLIEIIGTRSALSDVVGHYLDLGPVLAALTRLAGGEAADSLLSLDPNLAAAMPTLKGPATRLALWLDGPHFGGVREAISKRALKELNGPRRLRRSDPEGELKSLRVMAMALTATTGRLLKIADIQEVFVKRSKRLTANDFVDSLTRDCPTAH